MKKSVRPTRRACETCTPNMKIQAGVLKTDLVQGKKDCLFDFSLILYGRLQKRNAAAVRNLIILIKYPIFAICL